MRMRGDVGRNRREQVADACALQWVNALLRHLGVSKSSLAASSLEAVDRLAKTAFMIYSDEWPMHKLCEWEWPFDTFVHGNRQPNQHERHMPWTVLLAHARSLVDEGV